MDEGEDQGEALRFTKQNECKWLQSKDPWKSEWIRHFN